MNYLAHILPWAAERPVPARATGPAAAKKLWGMVAGAWQRVLEARGVRVTERRLRVVEKIALGDKQFVAVLELDGITYLASGGHGVPLNLIPAQSIGPMKKARTAAEPALKTTRGVQATIEKPKRPRVKGAAPMQKSVAPMPAERAATRAEGVPVTRAKKIASSTAAPEMNASSVTQKKITVPEPELKISERCAASPVQRFVVTKADTLPIPVSPKSVVKAPKSIAKTRLQTSLPELTRVEPDADATSKKLLVSPLEQAALEPVPSATTAFAALLELRMLASQVFEELDASPKLESPAPLQTSIAPVRSTKKPGSNIPAREQKEPSRFLHRIRGRISAYACFLVLLLLPGIAHAQSPPGFSIAATHAISIARGSPFELGAVSASLLAEAPLPNGDIHITGLGGSSASWSIVVLLTLLTLIPALLLCITPFARLLIVFHFLRQALGLQTTPSNQTLIGLSLILTFFLMQPTGEVIYREAILPAQAGKLTPLDAVLRAGGPMRHFMAHYVREKDAELFLEIAKEPRPRTVEDMSFRVLLPSYILSELKAGFQIGTVLFLPFLIVDMVVASITTSVGMMQLPPVVISTPLKLLLFLMVDGWHLLIGALMRSFS